MKPTTWFSAKMRFAILIEDYGGDTLNDCVFVFKASDFDTAFDRAIATGKRAEKSYVNGEGKVVMWTLTAIISLDMIPADDLDGAEIYSEPVHLGAGEILPFDIRFRPEDSKPIQTL